VFVFPANASSNQLHQTLYHWYDYRSKKVKKLQISKKADDDPISLLLKRLLGTNDGPGKRSAGWQLWGKDHFDSLKSEFNEEFKSSGKREVLRAQACNEFKKARFAMLSEEEQGEWNSKASNAHEAAKRRVKDREMELETGVMSPEDAQM
jgi:hypothetical protein